MDVMRGAKSIQEYQNYHLPTTAFKDQTVLNDLNDLSLRVLTKIILLSKLGTGFMDSRYKSRRLPTAAITEMDSKYTSTRRELHKQFADININTVILDNSYWI